MRLERGLAALALVVLGLIAAVIPAGAELLSGPADAVIGRPVRTVLAAEDGRTVVQITFPVETAPSDWSTVGKVEFQGVVTEDAISGSDEIVEIEAEYGFQVAVESRTAPTWRVAAVQWYRQPRDPAAAVVKVGGPAVYRGVPLARVSVFPEAGGGILAGVIVETTHPVTANLDKAAADTRAVERAGTEQLPGSVVNPGLFRRLRVQAMTATPRADKAPIIDAFALADNWVRLELDETGVYALTGRELELMGVSLAQVDPDKLRLYKGGGLQLDDDPEIADAQTDRTGLAEVAIRVEDGADGEFNADDRILFYGLDVDVWRDRLDPAADRLDYYDHPHQAHGLYWLTWENLVTASPLPGAPRRIPAAIAAPTGGDVLTTHSARYHGEENVISLAGYVRDNWVWDANVYSTFSRTFDLPGAVANETAQWQMDVVAIYSADYSSTFPYQVSAYFNSDSEHAVDAAWVYNDQVGQERMRISGTTDSMVPAGNRIFYVYNNYSETNAYHGFDSFDVSYRATLAKADYPGALACGFWGDDVATPGTAADIRFTLPTDGEWTVWDVSRPDSAVALSGSLVTGPPRTLTVGLVREPGVDRHLVLFGDADLKAVAGGAQVQIAPLRETVSGADYIVVHPAEFGDAAQALAAVRSGDLPGVASPVAIAVTTEDIYANFSGGQKDWRAIRQFLRWTWLEHGQRLRWVCLLGDASRDHRNYRGLDADNGLLDWIPMDLVTVFPWQLYGGLSPYGIEAPYATDESLTAFDSPPGDMAYDISDVAIGRLPATSAASARRLVDRVTSFVTDRPDGAWGNRVVFCADDLLYRSTTSDFRHTLQAETLANESVPWSIDLRKVYLLDYPLVGLYKPDARRDLLGELGEGASLFYYVGHGAADLLADEQVFRTSDIAGLTNENRRFVFMAFSCDVGVYDDPDRQCMGEDFLTSGQGGAIGTITASWLSYRSSNNLLSDAVFENLYPGRSVSSATSVGHGLMAAKGEMAAAGSFSFSNARRYNLMGDPAIHIPNPVDDVRYAADSADSLLTGRLHRVRADLATAGIMSGPGTTYDISIEDSGVLEWYYRESYNDTDYYWLRPGNTVFRGQGSLLDDDAVIPFLAPLTLRTGDTGRIRCIIDTEDGSHAAVSIVDVAQASASTGDDVQGPLIRLGFEDGRIRVRAGDALTATLRDTSGVNILASNPANSVLLEFDRTGIYNNVSDDVIFEPGSYTRAVLATTLPPDLELGSHTVVMTASDMFGNVGSDTLSFELEATSVAGVRNATVFPNPTPGPCRLVCDLSDPMALQWDIYTVSGRCVRTIRSNEASAGPAVLSWDGRDGEGDNIANGVYLYVLRGRLEGDGHEIRETGQLVIMR